jgi:hypothetical protein
VLPARVEALPTYCSDYHTSGTARSYCKGGLGRHRIIAVDNAGRVYYGSWKSPGSYSMVFALGGRWFVSSQYQVSG